MYLVAETRRSGVVDFYPDAGANLVGARAMMISPEASRFVLPLTGQPTRVKIVLHYISGSPLDELVRFMLVEKK
jgi:hypothetical protein